MAFATDGFVLRPPRTAPANARSTGPATSGVVRDHNPLPAFYAYFSSPTHLLEVPADMYRAAVLDRDGAGSEEYLVWAANSSSLTVIEDPIWTMTAEDPEATVTIPKGTLTVTDTPDNQSDGTSRLVVQDPGGRGIAQVRLVIIQRGDTGVVVQAGPAAVTDFASQDPDGGVVVLAPATLTALGGGVSKGRGDSITQVDFILSAARFWWTRNDSFQTRFGWNGRTQRWEPFKALPPRNLGPLTEEQFTLFPRPTRFTVGTTLPGTTGGPDTYALIRVGYRPDAVNSTIPQVRVVADAVIEAGDPDFTSFGNPDAIVGQGSGILLWNPTYAATNAGLTVWYIPEQYDVNSDGALGPMLGTVLDPLFLTPIPGPTERPFIRLGFRRHLNPIAVATDADLPDQSTVPEGTVYWSMTTGRLAMSEVDLAKADPDALTFDLQYLGNQVYCDGVSLTTTSIRTPDPVALLDESGMPSTVTSGGKMYIPEAVSLPFPGVSGVRLVPDGTGQTPTTLIVPGTRENGSGLVRQISGIGDTIVFTPARAFDETNEVEFKSELPPFPFAVRKTRVFLAKELVSGDPGSAIQFKRSGLVGQPIYFLQAEVMPAVYASDARIYSRQVGPFTFVGGERLYYAIDGVKHTWTAPAGTLTATAVATSIASTSVPAPPGGTITALRDRVVISSATPTTGKVEVGFGPTTAFVDRDLSGSAVLGFLPGWRIDATADENWLPDDGTSLGVYRSPLNKGRTNDTPDFRSTSRFSNTLLSESLIATPSFPINNPPLQDVAGYNENVFFVLVDGLSVNPLDNLTEVYYDFANFQFLWLDAGSVSSRIETVTGSLSLGNAGVLGLTLNPAVAVGNGFRLAADGQAFVDQIAGVDYLVPGEGAQGVVVPIEVVGGKTAEGSVGEFAASTVSFSDGNATFITDGVLPGYRLHVISGDAEGSYIVDLVVSETELQVVVDVPFPANAGPSNGGPYASWRLHKGFLDSVYDAGVVADVVYERFNHLPSEPFIIRLLSGLGDVPASPSAQISSRLVAVVTEAFQRGRVIRLRFGQPFGSPSASLTALERGVSLGEMANGSVFVPNNLDVHFTTASFAIRIGSKIYAIGSGLTGVGSFSDPLLGDVVQYLTTTGELKFGEAALADLAGSQVSYDEEFLPAASLSAGNAEFNPVDGEVNIAAADLTLYHGEPCYFVEQVITEDALDVQVSPMIGSFYFNRPLRAGQMVEVSYYQADSQGNKVSDLITEFLPLIVRQETAVRVTATTYTVNPTARTVSGVVSPLIWVDNNLQNFGNASDVTFSNGVLTFASNVGSSAVVQVNYGVLEAFGGEQAYNTSRLPVYRPPFFLTANQNAFVLEGDRTGDLVLGKLLRLGAQPFYIKSATFNPTTGGTTVTVFPTSNLEAGSRAPGNDVLSLLSSVPVTTEVDGVSTGYTAAAGFLLVVTTPYEPIDKGMTDFVFQGDLTRYAVAGHLLELDGYPFIVAAASLSSDGRTTLVSVTSPATRGFDPASDAVRLSVRPIYPTNPTQFLGVFPFVPTEFSELVLFAPGLPGRTLVQDVHYKASPDTGAITLLSPLQEPLAPRERLVFSYTRLKVLAPFVSDGAPIFPRYEAGYSFVSAPSEGNGRLGASLLATYTFRSPDSFYYQVVPLSEYMGEVAQIAVSRVQAQSPAGGAVVVSGASVRNQDQGRFGFEAQRRDLLDQDRASRSFVSLYNDVIVAFEQVVEAIDGGVVGDHDGKFRFYVGRGRVYAPPGYEDGITGDLNVRLVWSLVFHAANGSFGVVEADPVVDPETASQDPTTLVVDGKPMDPFVLDFYIREQLRYVLNDMDDRVLADQKRPFLFFGGFHPQGRYRQMWEPSRISRLFPESTLAFSTTFPGIEADLDVNPVDPGVYAFLKVINPPSLFRKRDDDAPTFASTFLTTIGVVSNPVLGTIENISDIITRERLPRARIWAYSPNGFPEIDALFSGDPNYQATAGFATVLATPGFIKDFPVVPETGLPDFDRFYSNDTSDSDTIDLQTGDPDLSTPAFVSLNEDDKITQQVAFGRPTGEKIGVGNAQKTLKSLFGGGRNIDPTYGGVFVGVAQKGCILILADDKGNLLSGSDVLAVGVEELAGSPVDLNQGDTVYVVPAMTDTTDFADPPKLDELEKIAESIPKLDVGTKQRRGLWVDVSLPSWKDPNLGLKEITNQKTPKPMSTIEATVDFANNNRSPTEIPALLGETTNDAGDYSLPYLALTNTELDRLGDVSMSFVGLVQTDSPTPQAVYPNEIVVTDGEILEVSDGVNPPARLFTATGDFTPVGTYVPNSGVGNLARWDLLLVEVPNTTAGIQVGGTGILTVGDVTSTTVEVPRFITQTFEGDPIYYTFDRVMSHVSSTFVSGLSVTRIGPLTIFNISSTGIPVFDDGTGSFTLTGGLNDIFATNNAVIIRVYQNGGGGSPGALVEEIVLTGVGGFAHGGAGADRPIVNLVADDRRIIVNTVAAFVTNVGTTFDYTLTIDTFIDVTTDALITSLGGTSPGFGNGDGSTSGWIDENRLTLNERYDMRSAPERGMTLADGVTDISAALSVWEVTASGMHCSVNNPATTNGNLPFTFLSPDGAGTIGTWVPSTGPGTGDELGTVRVMSWEASNIPVGPVANLLVAGVPSSNEDASGVICTGTGHHHDSEISIVDLTVSSGQVSRVVPGDILVVKQSAAADAAVAAGTYLVRHVVEDNSAGAGYREVALAGSAGAGGQWFDGVFPTVAAASLGALAVTLSSVGTGPGAASLWDLGSTMNRLFIVPSAADPTTVVSMRIASFAGTTATLVAGTGKDAAGAAITDAQFFAQALIGRKASGFRYVPIGTTGQPMGSGLPSNSVVGFDNAYGFVSLIMSNAALTDDATTYQAAFVFGTNMSPGPTADGSEALGIVEAEINVARFFNSDEEAVVYHEVPGWLDLLGIPASGGAVIDWEVIHGDSPTVHPTSIAAVRCLLPADKIVASSTVDVRGNATGTPGFQAEAGIFLEPSFPRPVRPLDDGVPHVVDSVRTATSLLQLGMRNPSAFGLVSPEVVAFEVRRIRRFHDALNAITANLTPLRFAYEIREGAVLSYTASSRTLVASVPTQLGSFTDPSVNVNPGDVVRVLNADGDVVDSAEIAVVVNATTLILRKPGFTESPPTVGSVFQVFLRQAPVPHEQSNEQLLSIITDDLVHTTTRDFTTGAGGRVDAVNELKDTSVADFTALGLKVGDIIVIDPAGSLEGPTGPALVPESGTRPFGDQSVPGRGPGAPYIAGQPSELDDNRGFYRVLEIFSDHLAVTGASVFSGEDGSDVTFGSGDSEYTVLPTISGSSTPTSGSGSTEGQQDLRITAAAGSSSSDPNSFKGNQRSIEPFSYRIIRASTLFSTDAIDLILLSRERVLSWMEELRTPLSGGKSGNYFVFQRDEHITDLGSPTNPDDGLGIISNTFVTSLAGVTDTAPFANTSDCLSVLDRRFWTLDMRLDFEVPPNSGGPTAYATFADGTGRPVLPDYIDGVLNEEDRFRQLRFAWIKFRTDRVDGTLTSIERFDQDLPRRLREQEDLLRMQEGLNKA